jgi:hypothetical protein
VTATRFTTVLIAGVVGLVAGVGVDTVLARMGQPLVHPPTTLAVALVLIGVIVVAAAWPVRRQVRGGRRVNPFTAARIVVLAQAVALSGALVGGFGLGLFGYLTVVSNAPLGSITWSTLATTVGGIALLVGGLVAERMCRVPPEDDDDRDDDRPGTATPA